MGQARERVSRISKGEDLAKEAHDSRVGKIHELVEALDPQVPKLTIHVPKDGDTSVLKVWIDGALVETSALSEAQLVDPGPHLIESQIGHAKKKSKVIPVDRGSSSDITLDVPPRSQKSSRRSFTPVVVPTDPGRTQKIAGIVSAAPAS